jgi:hypothetical protein
LHNIYKEKTQDLEKFEAVSKFYKFLQPLSKRELQKRYKVKGHNIPNKNEIIIESKKEESSIN